MKTARLNANKDLHCEISSNLRVVDSVCERLHTTLKVNGLSDLHFPVELVARECLNNAIIHGNRHDAGKKVAVDFKIGRKWICLQIVDEGSGFKRKKAHKSMPPDNTVVRGRGLPICRLYTDRMAFNRKGNQITLWLKKRRTSMSDYAVEHEQNKGVVRLKGDLTAALVPDLQVELKALIDEGTDEFIFDLGCTAMLDSSGIGLLIATSNSLARKNGKIGVINVSDDIRQLLQSMRLTGRLNVSGQGA